VDLISLLSTIILTTTVATMIMGFVAYWAFKLRDKRRPKRQRSIDAAPDDAAPIFLARYVPAPSSADAVPRTE
jgi:cbb3-type cytochrome oxidase subunit 3